MDQPSTSSSSDSSTPPPTSARQRVITIALWTVLLAVVMWVVLSRFMPHKEMPVQFQTPRYALIDQEGKPFSSADLRGKAYVCDCIFTTCGSVCPIMTHKMAELQSQTPPELNFVSFTVNPEHDSPAVLKAYADRYGADLSRWHFLTGTPAQMTETVSKTMLLGFQPGDADHPITHVEKFLLVDGDGNVRGIYDSRDADAMKRLLEDANWLARTKKARG